MVRAWHSQQHLSEKHRPWCPVEHGLVMIPLFGWMADSLTAGSLSLKRVFPATVPSLLVAHHAAAAGNVCRPVVLGVQVGSEGHTRDGSSDARRGRGRLGNRGNARNLSHPHTNGLEDVFGAVFAFQLGSLVDRKSVV